MNKELTEEEKFIREELTKVWDQLMINEQNILGSAYEQVRGDIMGIAVEYFLQKPIEIQLETIKKGKLVNLLTYIANLQAKSGASKYWYQFRRFKENSTPLHPGIEYELEEVEEPYNVKLNKCIRDSIHKLDPLERMVLQERVLHNTPYADIEEKYKINYNALKSALQTAKQKIRRLCQRYH